MRYLNGRLSWSQVFNQVKIETRFDKYIKVTNIIDEYDLYDSVINVNKRIGSKSQNAEVFLGSSLDREFAIKVLPIINDNSMEKNKNELIISDLASQLVLENRSIHFPIVYGYDGCQKTDFHNIELTNKSQIYQKGETKSHILLQELCLCDLKQYFEQNKYISEDEIRYIKDQCYKAIDDMHNLMKVCHNDLHLGNFLLLPDNNKYGYIILICDFGLAEFRTTHTELDYKMFWSNF